MAALFCYQSLPFHPLEDQSIVLDTSELLDDFIGRVFHHGIDGLTELDKYISNIFEDITSREDAIYEVTYRIYEDGYDEQGIGEAYEHLARQLHRMLIELNAYNRDMLKYRFEQWLGKDIVVVLVDRVDYSERKYLRPAP